MAMQRVIIIDGDSVSSKRIKPLLLPADTVVAACNTKSQVPVWVSLLSQYACYQVESTSNGIKQSADMALAFASGEILVKKPHLKNAAWVVFSKDKDFHALSACLASRGVTSISQVHVHQQNGGESHSIHTSAKATAAKPGAKKKQFHPIQKKQKAAQEV